MRIGIFGQLNNGKSTFAKMLVEPLNAAIRNDDLLRHKPAYQITSFAYALKKQVCSKYGITMVDIEQWKNSPERYPGWQCTMRECLQREGELGRCVDPDVWIRHVLRNPYPTIVDDGRHENEATAIHNAGGVNLLIVRPDYINDSEHPSETYVGDLIKSKGDTNLFRGFIHNTGDLDRLNKIAVELVPLIITHFRKQ